MNYLFSALLLVAVPAWAQQGEPPAFASPEQAALHKAAFGRKVNALHLTRDPNWYYRYQVDVTKDKALRKAGISLAALDKRAGPGTYQENLLYTATVVSGTIIGQQPDERPQVYYHARYAVKVDEVLAGQVAATVLTVCLRSGKMGEVTLHAAAEPAFDVGERVLLYLNPVDAQELAAAKAQGLWPYENNAQPGDFNLVEKYAVKDSYVFDGASRVDKTATVSANIRRIVAVLDKAHFYQKSFD